MKVPNIEIPIVRIPLDKKVELYIKREDQIHPEISGNKYWKLFFNINKYLGKNPKNKRIITFGGAYSNHIAAVAALGKEYQIPTLGIIRGEELHSQFLENSTLKLAHQNEMDFRFVDRNTYREKEEMLQKLQLEFPDALLIPEGGTNANAIEGVRYMLGNQTKSFDYLCTAVGTGGTVAGISKFGEPNQKVLGFKVVKDDSLLHRIFEFSGRKNVTLLEAHDGKYGKITDENVAFIQNFWQQIGIPLDPIYTGKMMRHLFDLINENYFPEGSRILAFHTGGLQGIEGANQFLKKQNRTQINIPH